MLNEHLKMYNGMTFPRVSDRGHYFQTRIYNEITDKGRSSGLWAELETNKSQDNVTVSRKPETIQA